MVRAPLEKYQIFVILVEDARVHIIRRLLLLLLSHEGRLQIIKRVLKLLWDLVLFGDRLLFLRLAEHDLLVTLACRIVLVRPEMLFEIGTRYLLTKFEKC